MRALVTGGAGFIGHHLVRLLLKEGHDVVVLDNLVTGKKENLPPSCLLLERDVRDPDCLPCFIGIDWVFHLAALVDMIPSLENPSPYFDVNVRGTFHVLEAARKANVKRFIYAASASCYGEPSFFPTPESAPIECQFPYALTKYQGERLVLHWNKVYQLPALSLRLFNVYGHGAPFKGGYSGVFPIFLAQKKQNSPLTIVGDGRQTRDFIYVEDVALALYLAAKSSLSGEVYNVGSGSESSINEIASYFHHPTIHTPSRKEALRSLANITNIKKSLQWSPKTSLREGINSLFLN